MGVLPLQLPRAPADLGLHGDEVFSITGLADAMNAGEPVPAEVAVRAGDREFRARVRIDTPQEAEYFRHGGILQYVLRSLRDR
jgi:aconitate hydratase